MSAEVLTIAHRAGNRAATLAAALDAGVDYVEADVRPFSLHGPVCRHERRPWILPILLDKWYVKFEFSPLPLEVVARAARARKIGVYADLKNGRTRFVQDVLHVLEQTGALEGAVISGHFWDSLVEAGRGAPVRVFPSIPNERALARFWPYMERANGPIHGVAVRDYVLTEDVVARFRARGLRVFPWTVDEPGRIRELLALPVDGVISNDLSQLRLV
ncbi:MAG: glycerophosphodiester phosphodiesterase [Dehalococcoidia bacterium]|nr:glycerophosphodiester phosphodiesterase [Dehalococcoidia bacterium]